MMSETDREREIEYLKQQITVHRRMANEYLKDLWELQGSGGTET